MITKQYLEEFEKELKRLEYNLKKNNEEIKKEKLKDTSDSVSGSNPHFPYEKRHVKVTGVSEQRLNKLNKKRKNVERMIDKLKKNLQYKLYHEDTIIAEIIEKRYIHKKEWKQIASDLKYKEESGARKVLNRYFNKNV